jgi:hypothetical protein
MGIRLLLILAVILPTTVAMAGDSVTTRWSALRDAKSWATAVTDSSERSKVPAPIDRIVMISGRDERLIYAAQVSDLVLGEPVISRDGSRIAFRKIEETSDDNRHRLYVMNHDGTGLRAVVEFRRPGFAPKGATMGGASSAWSFDNRLLVTEGTVTDPPLTGRRSLVQIDVQTGAVKHLIEMIPLGPGLFEPAITSQAWAPDNRRLVYTNEQRHAIILDTVSGMTIDIGPGRRPAWSPDGRFIAVQERGVPGEIRQGDYVLIQPDPPHHRSLLLSNARRWYSPWRFGYLGPPVWMPDSRFVLVFHQEWGRSAPYVLDRTTKEIEKIPGRFGSESWGGKP